MSPVKLGMLVAYLAAVGGLGYHLQTDVAESIESGINDEIQDALPNGTRHGAEVKVSGRDIEVSGLLHDSHERDALVAALEGMGGQRVVRVAAVRYLPVAITYRAELKVQNDTVSLQTVLPDELAAAQMRGTLGDEVAMDYSLASGLPDADWPAVLTKAVALSAHLESGAITLTDRQLTVMGLARTREAASKIAAYGTALPAGYGFSIEELQVPPLFAISLNKPAGAPVSISGKLPKGTDLVAFLDKFRGASSQEITLGRDLEVTADGNSDVILAELTRIAPFLDDLKAYSLTMEQEKGLELAGTAKPNVDLERFDAQRQSLGFQAANIDVPEQFDIEFRLDARIGAELIGTAPEGFDPTKVAETLGLPTIKRDNLDIGARGDSVVLTDQISRLKPVLQDVETMVLGLEGEESEAAPKAEISAETLPNVDPARISDLLGSLFDLATKPQVAVTKTKYSNGQIRVNGITGIKERYFDGFWMPLLEVAAASAQNCRNVTDSVLRKNQIAFASGEASLDPSARVAINRLAGVVSSCFEQTDLNLELAGHTDNQGDQQANMLLSILRVNAVRDALVARGLALARILTVGYGETQPIADNGTPEGRRANRRTEFSWLD